MRFVENVASWWKWHSTYVFGLLGALPSAWANSPDLQQHLSARGLCIAETLIAIVGFVLRIRSQAKTPPAGGS